MLAISYGREHFFSYSGLNIPQLNLDYFTYSLSVISLSTSRAPPLAEFLTYRFPSYIMAFLCKLIFAPVAVI